MTRPRLPSLIALRAFEAVGRRGSVRAAGDELAVSHTVVSRHLQNLQRSLGVALVRAEGRGLALTEAGRQFHAEVTQAFDIIARATTAVRPAARPTLNIWCIPGLANRRLLARLPELTGPPRNWDIHLQPTLSHPDLPRGEADAEIVYAEDLHTGSGLMAEALARPRVFPVASPAYLARFPEIVTLAGLAKASLIHEESTAQWERWFELAGYQHQVSLRGQRLWHAHLAIEAARIGQGVALANEILVAEDIRSGALVEVMPSSVHMGAYQLVALRERWDEPAIIALRAWLKTVLA
ncbi:LysR substrate-binding domain-containing protein [Bradyrhizobium sp. STM 3809]|uniref:LysR substrate-binding domain-containing protein n=1 Tax=Bradyrhizobium sp. STM 3809 TaxID=551936 RepID=UPI0002409D39|nr:LysR substrate-binding domain-containing protein [Bradyrhizobium sp. STM 3809]CCE01707.1 putative transcriptional regulatory protein, LysR family [Bradyrhizobium sp. STM 3809]